MESKAALGSLLISLLLWRAAAAQTPLYFSLILSFGRYGFNSSGTIPAMEIALERVEEMQILPGYKLENSPVRDSECHRSSSLNAFFNDVLQSPPVKLAVIGCGCSVATEPVAEISHHWNISQISPASAASTLSDRSRFKKYFRTDPTFEIFAPAVLSLLEHYNWSRIVFLTQNENLFNNLYSDVKNLVDSLNSNSTNVPCCFQSRNITVVNRPFETNKDPIPTIKDIFDEDYRIFFLNSYSTVARRIICEAAHRNLISPRYVWISHGWYSNQWWTQTVANEAVNCSDAKLEVFLANSRTLAVNHLPAPTNPNAETAAGITPNEFLHNYEQRATAENYIQTVKAALGFDAVWALATALNKTAAMVQSGNVSETGCEGRTEGDIVPLEHFNYSNGLMGCVIQWNLQNTNFLGTSGRVQFDSNGSRIQDRVRLYQYRMKHSDNTDGGNVLEAVQFGYTESDTHFNLTYLTVENDHSVFPGLIPPDGSPEIIVHTFHVSLVAVYCTLAALGILLAIACLVFNFAFRKRKVIKLTSPNLNYFLISGIVMMYSSVYIGVLFTTNETCVHVRCILHPWLYIAGYLLAFGTVLAKMWRVYHIFHNPAPSKMKVKDWHLVIVVLGVTAVGIALLVARSALLPKQPKLIKDSENSEGRTELGIRQQYYVWSCYDPATGAFYCDLLIFAYLALLQIVGIVLAFQTRKVKISALNDSTFVAALVYISSVVLVALVLVTFALRNYINIRGAIFSGGNLLLAYVYLILMFVPKMINLYRDPSGEKIFDKSNTTESLEVGIPYTESEDQNMKAEMIQLQNRVREHEESIQLKNRKISELERTLMKIEYASKDQLQSSDQGQLLQPLLH